MKDSGHYIGMHTMTHNYNHLYGENGPANFVAELKEEQALIEEITGGFKSELCRAPYGTGGGTFKPEHIKDLMKQDLNVGIGTLILLIGNILMPTKSLKMFNTIQS